MHYPHRRQVRRVPLPLPMVSVALAMCVPGLCLAQASPFMTGASALQSNILAWLTPIAIIDGLKDALARLRKFGGRCCLGFQSVAQVSGTYGSGDAQTLVENCGNTLILRCSASEHGGTSHFASRLIGEREISRKQISRGSDREALFAHRGGRRSKNTSEQRVTEAAVMPSEIEGLPDFCGYLKVASASEWLKVSFERSRSYDASGIYGRVGLERKYQRPLR
jgi:hypothetical protein